jgi:hypothetical protein
MSGIVAMIRADRLDLLQANVGNSKTVIFFKWYNFNIFAAAVDLPNPAILAFILGLGIPPTVTSEGSGEDILSYAFRKKRFRHVDLLVKHGASSKYIFAQACHCGYWMLAYMLKEQQIKRKEIWLPIPLEYMRDVLARIHLRIQIFTELRWMYKGDMLAHAASFI